MNYAVASEEHDSAKATGPAPMPCGERVAGRIKWYDLVRGYGFVTISGRNVDAMLHGNVVPDSISFDSLLPGVTLDCEVMGTNRGLRVARIHSLDASTAEPEEQRAVSPMFPAMLKFFKWEKGFGFFFDPQGGDDIFIHYETLARCGIDHVLENQTWLIATIKTPKGQHVVNIAQYGP